MKYPFITYTCDTCCAKDSLSNLYANYRYLAEDDTTSVPIATQLGWCACCACLQPMEDLLANRRHITQEITACPQRCKQEQLQAMLDALEQRTQPVCLTCGQHSISRVDIDPDESISHPLCGGRLVRDQHTLSITLREIANFILYHDAHGQFVRRERPDLMCTPLSSDRPLFNA